MSDLLGGLFGDDSGAQDYLKQALAQYQNIQTPTIASETVNNLPQETVQGTITPEQQQAATQGNTEFNNINLDPASRQAQESALGGYTDIANAGGLDANAKLGLQQAMDAANVQSQGAQGAIQQQMQAQGQGGGLNDLALRSIAAQGASNTAATQGMQSAAMAEANREAALGQMANIGGSINASDFNQGAARANAQDVINASNTGIKNNASQFNIGNNMNAQGANIANAQGVNAANTTANQGMSYYNAGLPQQQFNNALAKANGMAGVSQAQAGAAQQASGNQAAGMGQLLKGGLTLGATAMGGPAAGFLASGAMSNGGGTPIGNAPGIGPVSTPKNSMQYKPTGYADGGEVHNHFLCMLDGGCVYGKEGQHAEVAGDSERNDKVPAMLSEGELVIPRSAAKDPEKAASAAKKMVLGDFVKGYKKGKR